MQHGGGFGRILLHRLKEIKIQENMLEMVLIMTNHYLESPIIGLDLNWNMKEDWMINTPTMLTKLKSLLV
jgi:hypothetical protein